MSEWDDLPEPVEADPEACDPRYRARRAAFVAKRPVSFTDEGRRKAGLRAASTRPVHPVTLRQFSWND